MTKQEILSKYAQDRTRCTVYTRVMGYHRPVETFNAGKQAMIWQGFSLEWYGKAFSNPLITEALGTSLYIALSTAAISAADRCALGSNSSTSRPFSAART